MQTYKWAQAFVEAALLPPHAFCHQRSCDLECAEVAQEGQLSSHQPSVPAGEREVQKRGQSGKKTALAQRNLLIDTGA